VRQIVLDTETTGLEVSEGHRIIEIGCVELRHRRPTGQHWHRYLRPDREVEPGALAVHGITNEFLASQPTFADVADEFLAFVQGAELVIHNSEFDVGFLDAELAAAGRATCIADHCRVCDTLALARRMHPGQRNNLDALCKRYSVDNSRRDLHGALLDAGILVDVYLAMTGGQSAFALDMNAAAGMATRGDALGGVLREAGIQLPVPAASPDELRQHEALLDQIHKASGGKVLWRQGDVQEGDGTHKNH
jgi:DNA polymerase-3 subunit epsilon